MSDQKTSFKGIELTPPVSILIAGVIIAGAVVFVNLKPPTTGADARTVTDTPTDVSVPLPTEKDHIIGSPTAPIVLIEYSDFQCPYCEMIYPSLKKIVSESNGEIAWVLRNYPLVQIHPQAIPAASAAECVASLAGEGAFWKFAEATFTNQDKLGAIYYESLATSLGANKAEYLSCIKDMRFISRIEAEAADAQVNGGTGTPYTVVLNTKTGKQFPVSGALPEAQLRAVINKAKSSLY